MRTVEHEDLAQLTPEAWRDRLVASIHDREQGGLLLPGFPDATVQTQFVGSSGQAALEEAYGFYAFVQEHGFDERVPRRRYLDFGCGWGRIGRFFLRDFPAGDMAGVDIDPDMIAFCRSAGMPGALQVIRNDRPLPFADASFSLVTAYSVFTHLPQPIFEAWLNEILRVLAPGGRAVITVEPPRFLDFIETVDEASESAWHASFAPWKPELGRLRQELAERGITYLPTGGGVYREADIYGETVVTPDYLERLLAGQGKLELFHDDQSRFWQAVAVISKDQPPRRNRLRTAVRDLLRG